MGIRYRALLMIGWKIDYDATFAFLLESGKFETEDDVSWWIEEMADYEEHRPENWPAGFIIRHVPWMDTDGNYYLTLTEENIVSASWDDLTKKMNMIHNLDEIQNLAVKLGADDVPIQVLGALYGF